MSEKLEQLKPVNYDAIVQAVCDEQQSQTLDQMVGRAMQMSNGKADPEILRSRFVLRHIVWANPKS